MYKIITLYNVLIVLLFAINSSVKAEKLIITASDGFKLAADFIPAEKTVNGGVLMLHQCNADRSMYKDLAKSLAKNGMSSLALDFRSYGDSVTDTVSREYYEKNSDSRDALIAKLRAVRKHWPQDVLQAYQFLVNKVGSNNISFIGASCGGGEAMRLALKHKPKSFIFFSSGMNEKAIGVFEKLSDIPALIVAAEGDEYTYKSSNIIYKKAKNKNTQIKTYKGSGHGYPLFETDPKLEQTMVDWFVKFSK